MKWAITGGGGQLARSLTDLLDKQGVAFRSWSKNSLDVSNPNCMSVIKDFNPNILINCAAWTDVESAETQFEKANLVNFGGAKQMALVARDLDIPLIHISTDYVFSGQADKPWKVSDETRPLSAYGKSKLLGEKVIKEVWPDKSIVLRTAWLYGPHGKNFAKTIIKKAASHEGTIKVVSDQRGQPTTTTDLAIKIIEVANSKIISGVFHATNSGEASWWDFARELYSLMGKSEDLVLPIPAQDYPTQVIRPSYTVLDHAEWKKVGLSPMRNWNNALSESFPSILAEVERELSDG